MSMIFSCFYSQVIHRPLRSAGDGLICYCETPDARAEARHLCARATVRLHPVGQADGSTVVRKKALLIPRALGGPGGDTTYYY
jgi:hypothetical protein